MNETIIIKERRNDLLIKGIPLLVLIVASLLLTFAPEIFTGISIMPSFFYLAGGLLTLLFGTLFVLVILRQSKPDTAMILTSRGFTDIRNIGEDIDVSWTNVSSARIIDSEGEKMLGISLENPDIVMEKMEKRPAAEMRANLEDNLPAIIILQSDILTDLNELKDLFNRFAREARALKTSAPKKQKNNPFTTEDVLRAFGKLPADDTEAPETEENRPAAEPAAAEASIETHEEAPEKAAQPAPAADDGDSFFNMILGSDAEKADKGTAAPAAPAMPAREETAHAAPAAEKTADDELPPEAREMLSKVRSSRITELEKILAGEIPACEYTAPAAEKKAADTPAAPAESAHEADVAPVEEENDDNVTFEDILRGSGDND